VIKDIRDCYTRGQPVLVGTTSIENSELLSKMMEKENLPHNVLNAKQHAREAEIVVQAGRPKTITMPPTWRGEAPISCSAANPDPEINQVRADATLDEAARQRRVEEIRHHWQQLHNQVVTAGGLHIIATERHESRRVDNQLRGRSGRQGDPGLSRFYLSLEDPLLRIFASDRVAAIMQRLKMPEGEAIEHRWVTRAIETCAAQGRSAQLRYAQTPARIRRRCNDQRKAIYDIAQPAARII